MTQALQVLSLHLPRILGARAVSPSSLLAPQPGAASPISPDAAVLQSALQANRGVSGIANSPLAPVTPPQPAATPRAGTALPPAQPGVQTGASSAPSTSTNATSDLFRAILQALSTSPQNGGYSGGAPLPRVVTGLESPGVTTPTPMPVAGTPPTPVASALAQTIQQALMGGSTSPIVPQFRRV
jgi:hypothetical protein